MTYCKVYYIYVSAKKILMKMDIIESNDQIVESLTNPMWGIMDRVNDNNNVGFKNIRNRHSSFYGKEHYFHTNIKFFCNGWILLYRSI
jgi:hypothetical protein